MSLTYYQRVRAKCSHQVIITSIVLTLVLFFITPNAHAGAGASSSFTKGNTRASVAVGSGRYFNDDYLILGAGIGYYIANGLEIGLDLDYWSGGSPTIYELTPTLTYVFRNVPKVQPYVGLFYSRTYIENQDDSNSAGARAGLFFPAGERMFIGVGVVYSELQDCTETIFFDCSDTYTEFSLMFHL